MSIWSQIWLVLAGVVGLVWFLRLRAMGSILRKRLILGSDSYDDPPDPAPRISVLVAARNEEDNIEACIRSLLGQDYPNFEVIAIDDRSEDHTPQILDRLQRRSLPSDSRVPQASGLRVVSVKELREGWFGKNNAMREGIDAATGDWLCFTDADCRQLSAKTLTVAMRDALAHDVDFLSITPVLETRTVWERIIQPVCALVLIVWFLPHRVNDPKKKNAYANGAFMLMRRSCYEAIGRHERVRTEVNEDIRMARLAKQMGLRLRVVENDDLYRTRMYRTPADAWRGWSRIFYGCLSKPPRLFAAAALVVVFAVLPWASLAAAIMGTCLAGGEAASFWTLAAWAWLTVVVLQQTLLWRVYPVFGMGRFWSLTYVVGAVVTLGMLGNAMLKALGATSTTWRGRTYRGNRLENDAVPLGTQEPAGTAQIEQPTANI